MKYVCLVDYSNSRGAVEMGLLPGPGGLSLPEMLAAADLDALWVVGANPLKRYKLAAKKAFVVVQDLFLTETARRGRRGAARGFGVREVRHGDQRVRRGAAAEESARGAGRPSRTWRSSG